MPRKIRDIIKDYRRVGATIDVKGGKGSHRIIHHPLFPGKATLSGKDSADAKHYQEKDLANFIKIIGKK